MPYIKQERRDKLDPDIAKLRDILWTMDDQAGDLNYVISRLVGGLFFKSPSYGRIAKLTGILENVKQEFYRRVAGPYEDEAIKKNGDLPRY